eukprot:1030599-Prymnesium_polylepis.1
MGSVDQGRSIESRRLLLVLCVMHALGSLSLVCGCTRRTSSLIMLELRLDLAKSTTISSDPPTCGFWCTSSPL